MAKLDPLTQERLKLRLNALSAERARKSRERHLDDIRAVVKTPQGRRLYWSQMAGAQYFTLSFVAGQPDVSAHNEGQRYVGKQMFDDLWEAAPEAFLQMKRENDSEQTQQRLEDVKVTKEVENDGD